MSAPDPKQTREQGSQPTERGSNASATGSVKHHERTTAGPAELQLELAALRALVVPVGELHVQPAVRSVLTVSLRQRHVPERRDVGAVAPLATQRLLLEVNV